MRIGTLTDLPADLARILIDEDEIQARVKLLTQKISEDYSHVESLYVIGILKGAFIFMADLTRHLNIPHVVDFMAVSSYGTTSVSTGAVRIIMDIRAPIEGQHVLVVEDIVDTGHTLNYLYQTILGRKPASLRTCVLLRKTTVSIPVSIDYLGFEIPDVWVVGYGLDYAERYRTLPYIAVMKQP